MDESKDNALTNALQWLCSPRGGNNFYGRVLNGCRRVIVPGRRTMSMNLNPATGKLTLEYDIEWFEAQPVKLQLFIVMHEACHVILRHIPRALWMYANLSSGQDLRLNHRFSNYAMDFSVNGNLLKKEMEELGESFPGLNPTLAGLPEKLMFEEYLDLLVQKAKKIPIQELLLNLKGQPPFEENDETDEQNEGDSGKEEDEDSGADGEEDEDEDDDEDDEDGNGSGGDSEESNEEDEEEGGGGGDPNEDEEEPLEFPRHTFDPEHETDVRTFAEIERLITEIDRETKEIVKHAYVQTVKRNGKVPWEIKSVIDELLREPEVPWEQIFRNMARSSLIAKMEESAVNPNYGLLDVMSQGIQPYPGLQCSSSVTLAVLLDTSGSITDKNFVTFVSELNGILKSVSDITLHVVMFDSSIQYENYMTGFEVDELRTKMKTGYNSVSRYGRGGTDFVPPFQCVSGVDRDLISRVSNCEGNWSEHSFKKSDLVVILTDGYAPVSEEEGGPIPMYQPNCPVIWVICGGARAEVHPAMGQRVVVISE